MPTIVNRARKVIAAIGDEYFEDEHIQYYVNKSILKVTSFMIRRELQSGSSLSCLDQLRNISNISISSSTNKGGYWITNVTNPNDSMNIEYVSYNDKIEIRELPTEKKFLIHSGNHLPTKFKGYYTVSDPKLKIYLHEDPQGGSIDINYLSTPTKISIGDSEISDIPERLENAVIYGAAVMMASQELNEGTKNYQSIYKNELKTNIY